MIDLGCQLLSAMRSVRESRSPGKSSATFDEVFTLLLAGGMSQARPVHSLQQTNLPHDLHKLHVVLCMLLPSLSQKLTAPQDALFEAVIRSHTEIVLTAHPTQVNRRTLQCALLQLAR